MKIQVLDLGYNRCDINAMITLWERASMDNPNPDISYTSYPVWGFYIEADGKKIVVDTGITEELDTNPDVVLPITRSQEPHYHTPEQTLDAQLALCGVKPEEIDYVVITHMHWDHAGNIEKFKNAKVIVQQKEFSWALTVSHTGNPKGVYMRKDADQNANWELIEGDYELAKGVKLLSVPGHAVGLQCLQLTDGDRTILFTSDACYTRINWETGIPAPYLIDSWAYNASMKRLKKIAAETSALVIFGHDMEQFESLPKAPAQL